MALQSSGQISFSNIAGELGSSTPYSLRSMSSEAGFSTPDTISEFYGYDAGGGGSLNAIFLLYEVDDAYVCTSKFDGEYYIDAVDFENATALYTDSTGSTFADMGYYVINGIGERQIRWWKGSYFDSNYKAYCY